MTHDPNIVESVARAIYVSGGPGRDPNSYPKWVGPEWRELYQAQAIAAIGVVFDSMTEQFAASHQRAGISELDQDDQPYDSEEHVREDLADFGDNARPVRRFVTEWVDCEPLRLPDGGDPVGAEIDS